MVSIFNKLSSLSTQKPQTVALYSMKQDKGDTSCFTGLKYLL